MKSVLSILLVQVTFVFSASLFTSSVHAEANGLDSRANVKVLKAKRMQAMKNNKDDDESKMSDDCSGVEIGNVSTNKNARANAPRDNIVVVTGDVIVVPGRNCR